MLRACVKESEQDALAASGHPKPPRLLQARAPRAGPALALLANTDKGVEVLSLDPRFSSDFRCLRPGGAAGLTVGRCDALESGGAARATAFVLDAGRLVHSSGACVVGRDQLSVGGVRKPRRRWRSSSGAQPEVFD